MVRKHAQLRDPRRTEQPSSVNGSPLEGAGAATSAWTADQRNQFPGQELLPDEESEHAALVRAAGGRELGTWGKFEVFTPAKAGVPPNAVVESRWAPARKMVDGKWDVKARSTAKGYQGPILMEGLAGTSGRASLQPSHLRAAPLGVINKLELWGSAAKNALLKADNFNRGVYLHAPLEWNPKGSQRIWKLRAPARGLNVAPAAA